MQSFRRIKLSLLPRRPRPPLVFLCRTMATVSTPTGDAPAPTTKSAAKKEEKRLEKAAKLAAKTAKNVPNAGDKKVKEKEKKEVEAPFVTRRRMGEEESIPTVVCADLTEPMAAGYNPIAPQFTADGKVKPEGVFVIPAPPPNVTGSLHIGHALTTAIQDTLIRWARLRYFAPALTMLVSPRSLSLRSGCTKASGKTRHDLGREKFLETVMDWKNECVSTKVELLRQLHRLGGSYDWDRAVFTMDERPFAVYTKRALYTRANRLVHWCVKMNTTLSNLEVDQKQLSGRTMLNVPGYDEKERFEFGVIVSFCVPDRGFSGAVDEKIIVATTRPETMLGDTAIAVHPEDPRYKHLHGKFAKHPFVDRRIPIVTDDIIVDMEFGTGAVGVRHKLDFINILNDDGTFNANAGETFKGMKRFHVRVAVIKALKDAGLYIETKDNPMQIPICNKSGDVVEPVLKPQWWVNCKPLAGGGDQAHASGRACHHPKQSENDWYRWLETLQDWCISRQLWWGHRCPAYLLTSKAPTWMYDAPPYLYLQRKDGAHWVVGRTLQEATERAKALAGDKKFVLEQDEDVLDTWFSSGLWPFSIMGWPDNTSPDLQTFYPSSLLETGWDILFFWVARMLTPASKVSGTSSTPIDVIEGLPLEALHEKLKEGNLDEKEIIKATAGQKKDFPKAFRRRDINLEILRVEGIFNATKFAMLKLDESFVPEPSAKPTGKESLVEQWILHKLNVAAAELNTQLAERNFMSATTAAYNFWLYELCDVYIEVMKPMTDEAAPIATRKSAQQTLYTCLDHGLRLLHPFMPFVTEELWQRLPRRPNDSTPSIMLSSFPVFDKASVFESADQQFNLVFNTLKTGRSLAASYNLQAIFNTDEEAALFESQVSTIVALTKGCKSAKVVRELKDIPEGSGGTVVTPTNAVHALVRGLVDLDVEIAKCDKKLDLAKLNLQKIVKLESQPDYAATVPANVQAANSEKRKTIEAEILTVELSKSMFVKLK
ncbi:tRNA synthetases class I-domain-containing protein [Mycena olivaceomarginata]|nr:tRNA synthetases class I-domain-containing protein [Mycena olivaceomarginata]